MFDVIVIGGGPAGVTAALRARELGAMVALVERGKMGEPARTMAVCRLACLPGRHDLCVTRSSSLIMDSWARSRR